MEFFAIVMTIGFIIFFILTCIQNEEIRKLKLENAKAIIYKTEIEHWRFLWAIEVGPDRVRKALADETSALRDALEFAGKLGKD